jgi:hypothetical protein
VRPENETWPLGEVAAAARKTICSGRSVTFIPATVFDNPVLLRVNPEYFTWLLSLPLLERERLLGGNWNFRPAAGLYLKRECAPLSTRSRRTSTWTRCRSPRFRAILRRWKL